MSPGSGVGHKRRARNLLLIFLPLTSALLDSEDRGYVGCLFSSSVCTSNEVCFNDLVIGQCISASSSSRHVARLGPLEDPELALLEAEMSRVFGLGYSWPDTYSQCVFQTFLHDITTRQPYDNQQCGHLLSARPEDTDDTDREEDPEDLFVPELYDDFTPEDTELHLQTDDYDPKYQDEEQEEQEAWLELQTVLNSNQQDNLPRLSEYIIIPEIPEEEEILNANILDDTDQMILVPIDDFDPDHLSGDFQSNRLPKQEPRDFTLVNYLPEDIPETQQPSDLQQYSDFSHPLEKREATFFDSGPTFEYILPEVEPVDYLMSSLDSGLLVPGTQRYEIFQHPNDIMIRSEEGENQDEDMSKRDRRTENRILLDDIYPEMSDEDISNYDFEYDETDQDQDDDILYYNSDIEPIAVESVFNRRERLDVKKPGPFYSNSPNNFYLDKLLPDESQSEEDLDEDPGQTEYEYPLSSHDTRQKKGLQEPLLSYSDPPSEDNGYLYINIKNRLSSREQAIHLWQYVADHLDLPKQVFSDFKPETSRILLKVNSNPKQLNATTMAKILENDAALKEHAKEDLGIEIDSFGAEDKVSVVSVYTGSSRLFLLLLLLTAGLAALLLLAAVLVLARRRSQRKSKQLPEENKVEKEEPVREYKQLVRDWSRSSRASQASERDQSKGAEPGKILARASQNSDGSRNSSTSSWQEDPGVNSMDISTGHMVLSYMEDHLKNKQRLEQEWVGLCAYEAEPNATSIAFKVENKKKNRYPDKLPYDHNRVLLNALVNGSNSDYINASTVMDHDPRNPAYIVTQGPMTHTVADFWQMVWEQGSVVIVMLSKLTENGYQLCHRYWPEEGSEQYHIFEVHLVSEHVWCEDYLVRSLYLKNSQTGETRTVTQFHFLSWPDGNIPTSTKAILEFRRKVNKSYRGRSCPMILHCSDGVGRSGTYVLIDMVLNRMTKGSKEIDIAATLEHIRDQRAGMVQTRSQFEFCLMAVAEETHAILKALPQ